MKVGDKFHARPRKGYLFIHIARKTIIEITSENYKDYIFEVVKNPDNIFTINISKGGEIITPFYWNESDIRKDFEIQYIFGDEQTQDRCTCSAQDLFNFGCRCGYLKGGKQ